MYTVAHLLSLTIDAHRFVSNGLQCAVILRGGAGGNVAAGALQGGIIVTQSGILDLNANTRVQNNSATLGANIGWSGSTINFTSCQPGFYFDSEQDSFRNYKFTVHGCLHPCPSGTYASGFAYRPGPSTCLDCPLGYFCTVNSTHPTPCPAGKFGNIGKLTGPTCAGPCSPGFFCPKRSTNPRSHGCPLGTYNANPGGKDSSACKTCGQGFFCGGNSTYGQPCPGGKYADSKQGACKICPEGFFAVFQKGSCTACPAGYFSFSQSTACNPCAAGRWSNATKATSENACHACPKGKYFAGTAATQSTQCVACSPGRYNNFTSSDSSSACVNCEHGKYSGEGYPACKEPGAGMELPPCGRYSVAPR